ncbi:MAG: hypothetical protein ACOYMZ_01010 [Minisyncoccia bacterium]
MKKTLLTNLKYIAFGLVFAFGVSVTAQWAAPSADLYAGNKSLPVHVGPAQIKSGGLSVQDFLVSQNSSFEQTLSLQGVVRGGTPVDTNSTVAVGSTAGGVVGNIAVSGNILANSYIQNQRVANDSNKALCADANGVINLCVPDMCRNISGNQETVPFGHVRNIKTGNCTEQVVGNRCLLTHNIANAIWELPTTKNYNPNLMKFSLSMLSPTCSTISTYHPTSLSPGASGKVLTVTEAGVYNINFSSSGQLTVRDTERTRFSIWVDFYVNINGVETKLPTPGDYKSNGTFNPLPDPIQFPSGVAWEGDFDTANAGSYFFTECNEGGYNNPFPGYSWANYTCKEGNWNWTFGRDAKDDPYTTMPYSVSYQSYGRTLNVGDTIEFYGKIKGRAARERTFGGATDEYVYFHINSATNLIIFQD